MVAFPQHGGCLCGEVRYRLAEDPVTLYVCHCTDCQRQSGASFALSMIVRNAALEVVRGRPEEYALTLPDGRVSVYSWGRPRTTSRAAFRTIMERAKLAPLWRWQSVQCHT